MSVFSKHYEKEKSGVKPAPATDTFSIALVNGATDKKPRHETKTLRDLFALFDQPDIRKDKDGAGITLGRFDAKTWKADPRPAGKKESGGKGTGWLQTEYCTESSGYLGDVDNKTKKDTQREDAISFDDAKVLLDKLGVAYVLHTTFTSTPDWERYRFIIPFAQPLTGSAAAIAARYKTVHVHLNALFHGALDSRSNPAFFAYLPAIADATSYRKAKLSKRPLFDPMSIDAATATSSKDKTKPLENYDFPEEAKLPKVSLSRFRVAPAIRSLIEDGPTGPDRSAELNGAYIGLRRHGMNAIQIVASIWKQEHRISEVVRTEKRGYNWLCEDVQRVLAKHDIEIQARDKTLFERYAYVERQMRYYDLIEDVPLTKENLIDRHINVYGDSKSVGAHKYFHMLSDRSGGTRVFDYTYAPGSNRVTTFAGRSCLNLWTPATVDIADEATDEDVAPWLELFERLIPEPRYRNHLFDWMACNVQRVGIKINHHPLIAGTHGSGKDTAVEPLLFAIGGGIPGSRGSPVRDRRNVSYVGNEDLDNGWGYHLQSQLICVQELREVYTGERRKLANKLKPLLASPPHDMSINTKYGHPFLIPNVVNWVFFSNAADAIALDDTERRFFAYWTNARQMTNTEAQAIWKWYRKGGLKLCARWLRERDISEFNPRARAPRTSFHDTLAAAGKTDVEGGLQELIETGAKPFHADLVSPDAAAEYLNSQISLALSSQGGVPPGNLRKPVIAQQISTALTTQHWHRVKRVDTTRGKKRITATIFVNPKNPKVLAKYAALANIDVYDAWLAQK